jgi:multiple sugar transport system permease protein
VTGRRETRGYQIFIHAAAIFVSLIFLLPFAWLVVASITPEKDLLSKPLDWIPNHVSLFRYQHLIDANGAERYLTFRSALGNSIIIATCTVLISMIVGVFGAYALARLRFRAQRPTLLVFLSTYMVPPIALVVPLYLIMANLSLLNTKQGLVIVYCTFTTPFVIWLMSNFFRTIPHELEDAARVDGCTRLGALFRVILPLAVPGLLATALFAFLVAWDEFLYALIFTSTTASKTVPVAISEFTGRYSTDFGLQAAGGLLAALPPVLIALAFQRYITGGLSAGAVKG